MHRLYPWANWQFRGIWSTSSSAVRPDRHAAFVLWRELPTLVHSARTTPPRAHRQALSMARPHGARPRASCTRPSATQVGRWRSSASQVGAGVCGPRTPTPWLPLLRRGRNVRSWPSASRKSKDTKVYIGPDCRTPIHACAALVEQRSGDMAYVRHLGLQTVVGAGAWLVPPIPTTAGRWTPRCTASAAAATAQERRNVSALCGEFMERFGDDALVCPWRGDRMRRRNGLRNALAETARAASLQVHFETPGFLAGGSGGAHADERDADRRPADVW